MLTRNRLKTIAIGVLVSLAAVYCLHTFMKWRTYADLTSSEREQALTDPQYRAQLDASLPESRACLAYYAGRRGRIDAEAEAKKATPSFLKSVSRGYDEHDDAAGLPMRCSPYQHYFRYVDQYNSAPGDGGFYTSLINRCEILIYDYELDYNIRLAQLRPELFQQVCGQSLQSALPEMERQRAERQRLRSFYNR